MSKSVGQFAPNGLSIGEVIEAKLDEINKRNIRIETKLTRLANGESDQGVTAVDYSMDYLDNVLCLRLMSGNVSIKQIVQLLSIEGVEPGESVQVFVFGEYKLKVEI